MVRGGFSDIEYLMTDDDCRELCDDIIHCRVPPAPRLLELHLTDCCNAKCRFCNQRVFRQSPSEINVTEIIGVVQRLSENGLRGLRLSGGGEPTIYSGIAEILKRFASLGLEITRFNTNGIELTEQLSELLIGCGLKLLHISLQAPTGETWACTTGRSIHDFDRVKANIHRYCSLNRNGSSVVGSFVIDEYTYDKVETMIEFCRDVGIKCNIHDLNQYSYSKHFEEQCVPVTRRSIQKLRSNGETFRCGFYNIDGLREFTSTGDETVTVDSGYGPHGICFAPWTGALIRANGDLYLCCALGDPKHRVGNVRDTDILEIWRYGGFESIRSAARAFLVKDLHGDQRELRDGCGYLDMVCRSHCPVQDGLFKHRVVSQVLRRLLSVNHRRQGHCIQFTSQTKSRQEGNQG